MSAGGRSPLRAALAAAVLVAGTGAGCGDRVPSDAGPWSALESRQFSVPLAPGRTFVEVKDTKDGWSERVFVERDAAGRITGVEPERVEPAAEPELSAEDAAYFRAEAGPGVDANAPAFERAVAISEWVGRRTYGRLDTDDRDRDGVADAPDEYASKPVRVKGTAGRVILDGIDAGGGFNCQSVANVFHDAARAFGLRSRRVDLAVRFLSPLEGHSVAEIWSPERGRWILMDPYHGAWYEVDGQPAGALDLHRAVAGGRLQAVSVHRPSNAAGKDPFASKINPLLYFRNVFVLLPSGHWLMRVDAETPPAPVARADWLQTDSDAAFTSPGDPLAETRILRQSRGARLAFQAIGDRLYVCLADDLFSEGRFEVRTSGGLEPAFGPDVPPYDPNDAAMFAPGELAPNATLSGAGGGRAPEGWELKGSPVSIEAAPGGGVLVEAGADRCSLGVAVPVSARTPFVAFARVRVERGRVSFGLRHDREGGAVTIGPGRPTTVSTIISASRRERFDLRLVLEPGTRCTVEWVSLRRALRLGEAARG